MTLPLLLHAAAAIVLVGCATHHGWVCLRQLAGKRYRRAKLQKTHATVLFWALLATFVIGLLIYPAFRVDVRAAYLDSQVPLATGFFEVKEHWLALCLAMAATSFGLRHRATEDHRGEEVRLFRVLGVLMMALVWFATATGLVLVSVRSI